MNEIESEKAFGKVKTWEEFLKLWSRFYSNEVYIPGYMSTFISEDNDNKYANEELGKLFQDITLLNLFCDSSQVSIKGEQKAYFTGYSFKNLIYPLFKELNRYEGISAIMLNLNNMKETQEFSHFPFITYSDWNEENEKYGKGERMLGNASTHLGIDFSTSSLDNIRDWLNKDMKKIISEENMCQILVWDANTSSPKFRLFEIIKSALNHVHAQNKLFEIIDEGDVNIVVNFLTDMKGKNIIPDVQESSYGQYGESMLNCTIVNLLNSRFDKRKEKYEQYTRILNLIMNEIKNLDVNLYNIILRSLKGKVPEEEINKIVKILSPKLPKWYDKNKHSY